MLFGMARKAVGPLASSSDETKMEEIRGAYVINETLIQTNEDKLCLSENFANNIPRSTSLPLRSFRCGLGPHFERKSENQSPVFWKRHWELNEGTP